MRISDWSSDVCSSDLAFRTLDQVALLVAVLLEVGLVPAAARQPERRRGHLAADLPGRAAGRARVGIRVGQLLQAVEVVFAGGTAVGVDRHGGWRGLLDAASLGPRQGITSATAPGCPTVAAAGRPDASGRTRPGKAARTGDRARRGNGRPARPPSTRCWSPMHRSLSPRNARTM